MGAWASTWHAVCWWLWQAQMVEASPGTELQNPAHYASRILRFVMHLFTNGFFDPWERMDDRICATSVDGSVLQHWERIYRPVP